MFMQTCSKLWVAVRVTESPFPIYKLFDQDDARLDVIGQKFFGKTE